MLCRNQSVQQTLATHWPHINLHHQGLDTGVFADVVLLRLEHRVVLFLEGMAAQLGDAGFEGLVTFFDGRSQWPLARGGRVVQRGLGCFRCQDVATELA